MSGHGCPSAECAARNHRDVVSMFSFDQYATDKMQNWSPETREAYAAAEKHFTEKLREPLAVPDPSVDADDMIREMWRICQAYDPDEGSVDWHAGSDQWWAVIGTCPHGTWRGESGGPFDISTAFATALAKMRDEHPRAERGDR